MTLARESISPQLFKCLIASQSRDCCFLKILANRFPITANLLQVCQYPLLKVACLLAQFWSFVADPPLLYEICSMTDWLKSTFNSRSINLFRFCPLLLKVKIWLISMCFFKRIIQINLESANILGQINSKNKNPYQVGMIRYTLPTFWVL